MQKARRTYIRRGRKIINGIQSPTETDTQTRKQNVFPLAPVLYQNKQGNVGLQWGVMRLLAVIFWHITDQRLSLRHATTTENLGSRVQFLLSFAERYAHRLPKIRFKENYVGAISTQDNCPMFLPSMLA
jgi:hypothetical protein